VNCRTLTFAVTKDLRRPRTSTRTLERPWVLSQWLLFSVSRGHCSCGRMSSPLRYCFRCLGNTSAPPYRMVTFSVALLLFCFVVSNLWTRTFVALMSAFVSALIVWWLWIAWKSDINVKRWLDGLHSSGAQHTTPHQGLVAHMKSLALGAVQSLRSHLPSQTPNDVSGVHSSTDPQGNVGV
jgi:hypothetical protein